MRSLVRIFGAVTVLAVLACTEAERWPTETVPPPPRPGDEVGTPVAPSSPVVTLHRISGDAQTGNAGEWLPVPMVVRVTDAAAVPVGGVELTWTVIAQRGLLRSDDLSSGHPSVVMRSDDAGMASIWLNPTAIGEIVVRVTTVQTQQEPVAFTATASGQVISNESWWGEFYDVAVPLGTPVEWVNEQHVAVLIRSLVVPPDGNAFEATLGPGERFRMLADVAGQWEWVWSYEAYEEVAGVAMLSVGVEPKPLSPLATATAVSFGYLAMLRERVPHPAISNSPESMSCSGEGHLTTTAYLPADRPSARRLLTMYRTRDGRQPVTTYAGRTASQRVSWVIPAGRFKVLTLLVTYQATTGAESISQLEAAQAGINQHHDDFANSRGYAEPIVQFDFTNVVIRGDGEWEPRTLSAAAYALSEQGLTIAGYDFVVVLNPNPARIEGGKAVPSSGAPHFVYVGNYGPWTTRLTAANFANIAAAAYHHEIAHHWGWEHDWTPRCSEEWRDSPFVTDPMLFGWEDTDGDGIPEILDPTPYGRQ